MTKEEQIRKAKEIADQIRIHMPEKAAEIDRLIIEAQSGQRESLNIKVGVNYRLEKYDGEYSPDKTPNEIVEGEG